MSVKEKLIIKFSWMSKGKRNNSNYNLKLEPINLLMYEFFL